MITTVITGAYHVSGDVCLAGFTAEITHTKNVRRDCSAINMLRVSGGAGASVAAATLQR